MRKTPGKRRRLVAVHLAVAVLIPSILLLSRNARSPLNDAALGLLVGVLLGMCILSLIRLQITPCDRSNAQTFPE